jgi:ATP-dependent DNA helicase RecG
MVAISQKPLGRSEISKTLGHKAISGAAKQALADLLAAGLIEQTIPEKPNSRLQKYRLLRRKHTP